MYNFNFTIPSVFILLVMAVYFLAQTRLPVRRNRLFFMIVVLEMLVIVFDVLSSWADMNPKSLPLGLSSALNMAFFVFFLIRIYAFFLYTVDALRLLNKKFGRHLLFSLVFLVSEIITLSSFWTGAVYRMDALGYHRGPLYDVLYVCFFFYLLFAFAAIIRFRARLNRFQLLSLLGCNLVLLAGNIVRICLPQYLVMNTFCLGAILILYLSFESPSLYTSNSGGFTPASMQEYLEERIQTSDYRILGFAISNYSDELAIYGVTQMMQSIAQICAHMRERYPEYVFFNLRYGCFALAGPASMNIDRICAEITSRFRLPWQAAGSDVHLSVGFAQVSSDSGIGDAGRIVDSMLLALLEVAAHRSADNSILDLGDADGLARELEIKRTLDRAVETGTVEIYLQPIVDADTGEAVAAEALARLRGDDGALISPRDFIPLAERNGQISRLGDQVAERVCGFLRSHADEVPTIQWINVNLSPIQCMDRGLCKRFSSILERYEVPSRLVHLEVTEESMIDFNVLLEQMSELWKAGFAFSLDDYGSGYSNMSRVKGFPFTNIKLDMHVVWAHCEDPDQVLPTFIEVFRSKGFTITAEGIETEEMAQEMRSIGCDYLQGYYYSRPLPIEEFLQKYRA